ncbi:hypothetical protein BGX20_002064 [Mortierella sp. AD010]|nr:hypothetical protein BGX20_002064 [Mortierella sp. AD010]
MSDKRDMSLPSQEKYIVEILADPESWKYLDGDEVETVKEQYKMGSDLINRTGSRNLGEKTLEDQIKEICSFYCIVR